MKNIILMGTFVDDNIVPRKTIRDVVEFFESEKVFVFEVSSEETEKKKFLITFNIFKDEQDALREFKLKHKNTIQLHRNKENNALYTINGLNAIVEQQSGKKDKNHKVNWENYKNSCIVVDKENKVKVMSITLYDVIDI